MEIEKFPTRDSLDALLEICYDSFTVKRIFFRSLIKKSSVRIFCGWSFRGTKPEYHLDSSGIKVAIQVSVQPQNQFPRELVMARTTGWVRPTKRKQAIWSPDRGVRGGKRGEQEVPFRYHGIQIRGELNWRAIKLFNIPAHVAYMP